MGGRGRQAAGAPGRWVHGVARCVGRGAGRGRQVQATGSGGSYLLPLLLQAQHGVGALDPKTPCIVECGATRWHLTSQAGQGFCTVNAPLRTGTLPAPLTLQLWSEPRCPLCATPIAHSPSQMRENAERRRTVPMTDLERTINAKALDKVSTWQSTGRLPELSYSTHV